MRSASRLPLTPFSSSLVPTAFVINHFNGLVFEDCSVEAGLAGLCAHTGEEVLAKNSLGAGQLPETIACILGLFGTTCLLAFLILRCKSH